MGMGIATAVSMGPQLPHAFQVFPQLFSILVNLLHELMVQHGELQPTDYLVTTVAEEEAAAEEEGGPLYCSLVRLLPRRLELLYLPGLTCSSRRTSSSWCRPGRRGSPCCAPVLPAARPTA